MESSSIKLKVTLIIVGFVIFSYAEGWAREWKLYSKTDSYECFYDAEDLIRSSSQNIVEVWTKSEYTERGVTEMVKKFGKHYGRLNYSLELWEINCAEKKDRLLSIAAYSAEGNILYTDQAGSRLPPWKIISRESVEESLYKALCR